MGIPTSYAAILASFLLVACGGSSDSSNSTGESSSGSDAIVTVLETGGASVATIAEIESVLGNNSQITEEQSVTFVLPEDNQTLTLKTDLTVKGDLVIK